jgi:pyruvate dehydrogenase E2 component (dihydrolipoamide acetyltransferase)
MIELVLPALTWTMKEAKITRWLKTPGDAVQKGEPLLEVEMEKADVEVESPATGVLAATFAGEESVVPFLEVIGLLAADQEEFHAAQAAGTLTRVTVTQPAAERDQAGSSVSGTRGSGFEAAAGDVVPLGVRATPLAKKKARDVGVDLGAVPPAKAGGMVRESDVIAFAEKAKTQATAGPSMASSPFARVENAPSAPSGGAQPGEIVVLSRLQRLTGQRMRRSLDTAAHFWLHREVDMSEIEHFRARISGDVEAATRSRPSITAMLVRVVGQALKKHPRANASFDDGQVRIWPRVNIGVALATPEGLMVPVIRDADKKSVAEITSDLAALRDRAERAAFEPLDLVDGTFTISNLGMFGIDRVDSIINPPEAALLSAGRMVRKPVVVEGDLIEIRPIIKLSLAVDHRVLDGADGARLLSEIARIIENPHVLI